MLSELVGLLQCLHTVVRVEKEEREKTMTLVTCSFNIQKYVGLDRLPQKYCWFFFNSKSHNVSEDSRPVLELMYVIRSG